MCKNLYVCVAKIPDWRNAIIVARHPSQAKRATAFAGRLRLGIAVIHGELEKEAADSSSANDSGSSSLANVLQVDSLSSRNSVFELPNLAIPIRLFPKEKYIYKQY